MRYGPSAILSRCKTTSAGRSTGWVEAWYDSRQRHKPQLGQSPGLASLSRGMANDRQHLSARVRQASWGLERTAAASHGDAGLSSPVFRSRRCGAVRNSVVTGRCIIVRQLFVALMALFLVLCRSSGFFRIRNSPGGWRWLLCR